MKICKYIVFNNSKYAPFFHISLETNYRNLPPGAFASAATFHSPDYNVFTSISSLSVDFLYFVRGAGTLLEFQFI